MRLNKIVVTGKEGLKGTTFVQELTGADLFVGPNGSGKTTRLLAVGAGLRGLAQAPTDNVREYIGPNRPAATVDLYFGDRTLRRDLSKVRGKEADGSNALADDIAGPHLVRWDLGDFVRDSDANRAKLLERICTAADVAEAWTPERVKSFLLAEMEAETSDALHKLLVTHPAQADAGRWVGTAIEWARAEYTEANAAQKQAVQTAEGMEQERSTADRVTGDLDGARRKVAELEARKSAAKSALDVARSGGAARANHAKRGEELATSHAESEQAREAAGRNLDAARGKAAAAARDLAEGEAAIGTARVQRDTDQVELEKASAALEHRRKERGSAASAHSAAEARVSTLAGLVENAHGNCRHCSGEDPLGLQERLSGLRSDAEAASWTLEDAEADLLVATRAHDRARDTANASQNGVALAAERASSLRHAKEAAEKEIKRCEGYLAQGKAAEDRAASDLAAWQAAPAPTSGGDTSMLEAELEGATDAHAEAKAAHEAIVRQQEREAAFQRAVATREAATARFEQVKALGSALKALQAKVAESAYGPIQSAANGLLTAAGLDLRVEFRDAGDYGAIRGGTFIHFAALSDAERAEVGAALCYAFATLTKASWRVVLLDRMEVIDEDHLAAVLQAFAGLVKAGDLDNFLGAFTTTNQHITAFEAVTVHWLGGAKSAARAA